MSAQAVGGAVGKIQFLSSFLSSRCRKDGSLTDMVEQLIIKLNC